jgi:type IX secretion system PorP/SprF family membrane protein
MTYRKSLFIIMKSFLPGFLLFIVFTSHAQQRPHYTQYILNNYIINPAVAGIENYTDVKISHRHQWIGIQDAPVTTYLTIHGSIGKEDTRTNPTSYVPEGENPRGRSYQENYEAAKPHHGWGAQIINDKTGPLTRFSAYGTYAYHLGLTAKTSLSAGFSLGVTNNTLNANKLIFDNPIDPAVATSGYLNKLRPDLNFGLWLYGADYFAGVSLFQIIPQGLEFSNDTLKVKGKTYPHTFLTAGYKFYAGEDVSIIPSAVLRYVDPLPLGVDLNVKFQYRDRVWAGAGYRIGDGVSAMVGLSISSVFNVGYAYDYTTSKLQNFSRGTHEIVLGFMLGNKWGDMCPRNMW